MPGRSYGNQALEIGGLDLREVGGCSCLRLRKATRRVTQLYEASLEPVALTIGQFGVLANLFGSAAQGEDGCPVGTLADRLGVDPTTLKRSLAPLLAAGLAATGLAPHDRRVRLVRLTETGRAKLAAAVPLWAEAQRRLDTALGAATRALLDQAAGDAYDKLRDLSDGSPDGAAASPAATRKNRA